jgi:hemoglobin-like flavoprotein
MAAGMFYDRLFTIAPHLRPLFKSDLKEQGQKLMQMLAMVVHGLDNYTRLVPAVEGLGHRHLSYGVRNEDYRLVGEALLWTLGEALGDTFTDELREAWTKAYMTLAATMTGSHTRKSHDAGTIGTSSIPS